MWFLFKRAAVKTSATQRLLDAAALRLRWAAFGGKLRGAALIVAAAVLGAVLCARLLGVLPQEWFTLRTVAAAAGVSVLGAFAFLRKQAVEQVARVVDARAGSRELFLTVAWIERSPGDYRELVLAQAEERAEQLSVAELVPLAWARGARDVLVAFGVLTAAVVWLPRLDPFHAAAKRAVATQHEARLVETKKLTVVRKEELKAKGSALNEQVEQALAKLDKELKLAKPEQQTANAKKLNEEAQDVGALWKKVTSELPKSTDDGLMRAAQQFGEAQERKAMKELVEQLKKGDGEGLKKAMEAMQKKMQEMAKQPDGAEKQAKMEALKKELAQMANTLREQMGDKALNEALARAMEQMDLAKQKGMGKDAMDAANESLKLSAEELQHLAEMAKDAKNLEDALKNLQAAKALNEKGKLDGKDAEAAGAKTPQDYEQLYKELMAHAGAEGEGNGPPGSGKAGDKPGTGKGGSMGENEGAKSAFKSEKDKTQMGAGKLLMEWKEEGLGEVGAKAGDYENAVRAVKQGVAEAIRNEQVPPGYHGAIQKYFDKLPVKAGK